VVLAVLEGPVRAATVDPELPGQTATGALGVPAERVVTVSVEASSTPPVPP
jgi:hypothetical protein